LYLIYDAETNTLSHNTRYNPFTGLSFRNNDDEDWVNLPRDFKLILHEGMQLSFNLPSDPRRWWYSMDFYVGAFDEAEDIGDVDIEDDDEEKDEDDDDMVEEEEEHNNRFVVLLSDNDDDDDDDDDDDELPQLVDWNGCVEMDDVEKEGMCEYFLCLFVCYHINHHSSFFCRCLDLSLALTEPPIGPRTPCNVQEASRNPINDDDVFSACDRRPQEAIPIYAFHDNGHNITSMAVAVQPSLDPRPPPPPLPEDARVPILATPHRMPDPPGGTPLNYSSPLPVRLCSHDMFNMLARLSEDEVVTDDIAAVRAELEETQTQLQAALARNALLSPLEKGYLPLNSP
jgi:hypothetical protein